MYFLLQLSKFNLPQGLIQFHTEIIQSVLCTSITVWFGSAIEQDRNRFNRQSGLQEWQQISLQTDHALNTTCPNFSPLVGATEYIKSTVCT